MAKNTYYFSHDSNALQDTKIINMRFDYGMEGYGLYWAIIETLMGEEDYSLALDKKTFRAIKVTTNCSLDVEKYVNDCIDEYELFQSNGEHFWSDSLIRRMQDYEDKKQKKVEAGRIGGINSGRSRSKTKQNEAMLQPDEACLKQMRSNEPKEIKDIKDINNINEIKQTSWSVVYENNISPLTPMAIEKINSYWDDGLSEELIIKSIEIAVAQDARKLSYIEGILKNFIKENIKTLDQFEKARVEHKKKTDKNSVSYDSTQFQDLDKIFFNLN